MLCVTFLGMLCVTFLCCVSISSLFSCLGKGNVMNKLEKEAERIFNLQDGDLFFQGPKEQEEEYGRAF